MATNGGSGMLPLARILRILFLVTITDFLSFMALNNHVASSDHVARLWDLEKAETLRQYNGHHKAVVCIALNDRTLDYAE
jgi:hypothetical protein